MSINFADVKSITLPEGDVLSITNGSGTVIWEKKNEDPYTYLEYIEATGTQWIDTNIMQNNNTFSFTIDASLNSLSTNSSAYLVSNQNATGLSFRNSSNRIIVYAKYWNANQTQIMYSNISTFQTRRLYQLTNNRVYIDSNSYAITARTVSAGGSILIFSQNGSSGMNGKLYGFSIDNSDGNLITAVPAMRNSDNAVGMYDQDNDVFYTSAGTDWFIAGPII